MYHVGWQKEKAHISCLKAHIHYFLSPLLDIGAQIQKHRERKEAFMPYEDIGAMSPHGSRKQAGRGWIQRWQTREVARVVRKPGDTEQIRQSSKNKRGKISRSEISQYGKKAGKTSEM